MCCRVTLSCCLRRLLGVCEKLPHVMVIVYFSLTIRVILDHILNSVISSPVNMRIKYADLFVDIQILATYSMVNLAMYVFVDIL